MQRSPEVDRKSLMSILRAACTVTARGCWEWNAKLNVGGYARLVLWVHGARYSKVARAVLAVKVGRPLRRGEYALHKCDNRKCVRFSHIEKGTQTKNMRDASRRGHPPGPKAALSAAQIADIRSRPKKWGAVRALAKEFSVSTSTIHMVKSNRRAYKERR